MNIIRNSLRDNIENDIFNSNDHLMYHNKNNVGRIIRSDLEFDLQRYFNELYRNLVENMHK